MTDEDDGRKAEPISTAIDRTLAEIIRKNVEKRIAPQRVVIKKARTQAEIVAATLGRKEPTEIVRHVAFTEVRPVGPSIPERRPAPPRPALIPVTLRVATELPFPAVMVRLNGAVFVSLDLRVWRATTQYDRLVARFTPEVAVPAARLAIFKSLTSPTVLPRNVTLIKPPGFEFAVPKPVVVPPKKETHER